MYLTKNEFSVLCGIKFIGSNKLISEKFRLKESIIQKNKNNLCLKYGIKDNYRELLKLADFTKLEVFEENEIPYYEYEDSVLVKKIKIKKSDAVKLAEFFKDVPENKDYELIYDEDYRGFYRTIYIKDLETGIKKEIVSEITDELQEGTCKMNNEETAMLTGFKELDELTGGFRKGELILIGGRPAMGKTAFALNIALNTALKSKKSAAVFSLEMSKEHILRRMLCKEAEIDIQCITSGNMQQSTFEKLVNAMIILSEAPIFIDDTGAVFEDIREKCRKLAAADKNLSLVLIDYLQLLGSNGKENRFQTESTILKSLKILAKELDVPVVVLYQLSRRVEERDKKRPLLTDLTYPLMNEIPDKILFLYRDDYYDLSNPEKKGTAEIIAAKNNNGKTGTVNLLFDKEKQKFTNLNNMS